MKYPVHGDGTFTVSIDDNNIIYLTMLEISPNKEENIKQAKLVDQYIREGVAQYPGESFHGLVSAHAVKNLTKLAPEAQNIYMKIMGMEQVKKMAFVGVGKWLKFMLSTFTQVTGKWGQAQWFDHEADAVAWLMKEGA